MLSAALNLLIEQGRHIVAAARHPQKCAQLLEALEDETLKATVGYLDDLTDRPDRQHLRKQLDEVKEAFEEAEFLLLKHARESGAGPDAICPTEDSSSQDNSESEPSDLSESVQDTDDAEPSQHRSCACVFNPFRCVWLVCARLWRGDVGAVQAVCNTLQRFSDPDKCMTLMHYAETPSTSAQPHAEFTLARGNEPCDPSPPPDDAESFQDSNRLVPKIMQKLDNTQFAGIRNIGIVGMGGVGKTTIARRVFQEAKQKGMFDAYIWVRVGCNVSAVTIAQLLIRAFKQLYPGVSLPFDDGDPEQGLTLLSELTRDGLPELMLEGVRVAMPLQHRDAMGVLLVLDDVWLNEGQMVVKALNFATRAGMRAAGSRLIVTTREVSTLSNVPCARPFIAMPDLDTIWVKELGDASAECLFDHHAFRMPIPQAIADYLAGETGKKKKDDLIKSCKGNPLAITVLGRALRYANTVAEWKARLRVQRGLRKRNSDPVSTTCKKSVDALSPSLRECFVDFAAFPEDREVDELNLLYLFAVHAPLGISSAASVEKAKDILYQLVSRCLINMSTSQVVPGVCVFMMHDILRSIALEEAKSSGGRSFNAHRTPPSSLRFLSSYCGEPLPRVLDARRIDGVDHMRTCIKGDCINENLPWPEAHRLRYLWMIGQGVNSFSNLRLLPTQAQPWHMLKFLCLQWSLRGQPDDRTRLARLRHWQEVVSHMADSVRQSLGLTSPEETQSSSAQATPSRELVGDRYKQKRLVLVVIECMCCCISEGLRQADHRMHACISE